MGRMRKWEFLIELEVQDIVNQRTFFCSEDLEWTPIGEGDGEIDLCAAIPLERLTDFVKGEGLMNGMKTAFVRKLHREHNPAEYTNHTTKMYSSYWCAFGPEDNRNKPPNPQRIRKFQKKRGCQAHFQVRVMYGRPHVALITYNDWNHCDANGEFCHGKYDSFGDPTRALALSLSDECKSYLESLLLMGVEVDTICERHHVDHGFLELMNKTDVCMFRKDVLNAWKKVRSIRSQKHKDDIVSVSLWHVEEKENIFYIQWANVVDDVPIIVGIQTPWMQEIMVKHSHNSIIALDSTFFTNKYGFQLYTLLVFDEQETGIPVAWAISSRNKVEDINEWLVEVHRRGKQLKEDWHVNAFIVDDAAADIQSIRLPFDCRPQLCFWHIRKTWLKIVYRYARNKDGETQMFYRLGAIFCAMRKNEDIIIHLINDFTKEFPHEKDFKNYFKKIWCHDDGHIDVVAPLVNDDLRGRFNLENHTIDVSIPLENEDTERRFSIEDHTTDATKAAGACNEDLKKSENFLKSLLQNLPTTPDQIFAFNVHVERFRKGLHESGIFSFEFKSDPDLQEISLRRRSPWFSPIKMHKCGSSHPRSNPIIQDLNDTIEECEEHTLLQVAISKSKK